MLDFKNLMQNFAEIRQSIDELWPKSNYQDGDRRHLEFSVYVNLAIPACWQCGICVLYQICFKYLL